MLTNTTLADLQLRERVGKGSFGAVYRGVSVVTGEEVAIKVVDLDEAEDDVLEIQREIAVLSQCRSPYVTRYIGSRLVEGTPKLWIVMEYMAGGSLADLVAAGGPLDEAGCRSVMRELLLALDYLHGEQKIHRDVKAANVLLTAGGAVRLADFGVAGQLSHTLGARRKTFTGTPFWMAPEVIAQSAEGYDARADVWSAGITAIELATGAPPHAAEHPMRALFLIPKLPPPVLLAAGFSKLYRDFVAAALVKAPAQRPSAYELLKHRALRDARPSPALQERISARVRQRAGQQAAAEAALAAEAEEEAAEADGPAPWDFGATLRRVGSSPLLRMPSGPLAPVPAAPATPTPPAAPRSRAEAMLAAALASGGTVRMPAPPRELAEDGGGSEPSEVPPLVAAAELRSRVVQDNAEAAAAAAAVTPPHGLLLQAVLPTRPCAAAGAGEPVSPPLAPAAAAALRLWRVEVEAAAAAVAAEDAEEAEADGAPRLGW